VPVIFHDTVTYLLSHFIADSIMKDKISIDSHSNHDSSIHRGTRCHPLAQSRAAGVSCPNASRRFVEVCLCMALSWKAFLLKKGKKRTAGLLLPVMFHVHPHIYICVCTYTRCANHKITSVSSPLVITEHCYACCSCTLAFCRDEKDATPSADIDGD
jgi:hypothetical protein